MWVNISYFSKTLAMYPNSNCLYMCLSFCCFWCVFSSLFSQHLLQFLPHGKGTINVCWLVAYSSICLLSCTEFEDEGQTSSTFLFLSFTNYPGDRYSNTFQCMKGFRIKKETELGTLYLHYYLRVCRKASSRNVFLCLCQRCGQFHFVVLLCHLLTGSLGGGSSYFSRSWRSVLKCIFSLQSEAPAIWRGKIGPGDKPEEKSVPLALISLSNTKAREQVHMQQLHK